MSFSYSHIYGCTCGSRCSFSKTPRYLMEGDLKEDCLSHKRLNISVFLVHGFDWLIILVSWLFIISFWITSCDLEILMLSHNFLHGLHRLFFYTKLRSRFFVFESVLCDFRCVFNEYLFSWIHSYSYRLNIGAFF